MYVGSNITFLGNSPIKRPSTASFATTAIVVTTTANPTAAAATTALWAKSV